jgi:hypothetical protein
MKKIIVIFVILLSVIIYSNDLDDAISRYSHMKEFKVGIKINFEVDSSPTSVFMDIYVDNYKYFYFKIYEPKILSGIDYYYDIHTDEFFTDLKNDVDKYNGIKSNLEIFKDFIKILSVTYSKDKFFIKEIKRDPYIIYYFYPKSKTALRLLRVDYTQMKIYMYKKFDNYFIDKIEFFNSNNKKKVEVIFKIIPYNTDFIRKNLLKIQK